MALTPEDVEARTFTVVKRGYAIEEVTAFLVQVAQEWRGSDDFRRAGTEVADALRELHGSLTETRAKAQQEAEEILTAARRDATTIRSEAVDEIAGQRRTADTAVQEARDAAARQLEEAAELLQSADETATEMVAEATERARRELETVLADKRAEVERLDAEGKAAASRLHALRQELSDVLAGWAAEREAHEQRPAGEPGATAGEGPAPAGESTSTTTDEEETVIDLSDGATTASDERQPQAVGTETGRPAPPPPPPPGGVGRF